MTIMTIQETTALWTELVEKVDEFRRECMEEFRRKTSAGEVADNS